MSRSSATRCKNIAIFSPPLAGSAHTPERLNEEISNDDKDMIYADTKQEIATKRTTFIRKRRLERVLKKV